MSHLNRCQTGIVEDEKIAKILRATTDKTLQSNFSQCPEEEYHNMGE